MYRRRHRPVTRQGYIIDADGNRYLSAYHHDRNRMLGKMNENQRQAVILLERWGWALSRLYDDKRRQVIMTKPGEHDTVIYRN